MSDDNFDFEDDQTASQSNQNGPKGLRDYAAKEKQRADAAEAELKTLREERKRETLDSFIETHGLPEKARALIGDNDPAKWFEEFGDMFPKKEQDPPAPPSTTTVPKSSLSAEQVQQLQGAVGAAPGAFEPGQNDELESTLDALDNSAKSNEDFYAGLREMGAAG